MTKVKICGLSSPQAVKAACQAGADYIGFVFADSRRQVSLEQARDLAQLVPDEVNIVGVFVSPSLEDLEKASRAVALDLLQIHGDFPEEWLDQLSLPVIRAVQIKPAQDLPVSQADYLLFDAPQAGSGQTFDWQAFDPSPLQQPYFIAGGLNIDNVAEAIAKFSPYAVDVSSGVETQGQKDEQKIQTFIESVKS